MPIAIENPWWLTLGLPAAAWIIWVHRQSASGPTHARRLGLLVLRLVTVLLLVVLLAGVRLVQTNRTLNVIFVADASSSEGSAGQLKELAFIRAANARRHPGDRSGILYFGSTTSEGQPLTANPASAPMPPSLDPSGTNIELALQQAGSLLRSHKGAKRIVLISDGNENRGNALAAAYQLASSNIQVDAVPVSDTAHPEALVSELSLPHSVKIGEPFTVSAVVQSTVAQKATISLLCNGNPAGLPKIVDLREGLTSIAIKQTIHHAGAYRYALLMNAPHDTLTENNRGLGYVWVRGKPRVLYVANIPNLSPLLRTTMQQHRIDVQYLSPADLPASAAALQGYDAVFLSNVPASDLTDKQMRALQVACRDLGIGLGMVGGRSSFGAGGYKGTPIEAALPVSMDVKAQRKIPSVAVALVIEDLEMPSAVNISIQAAKSVVSLLQPIDQIGVLDCNGFGFGGTENATAAGRWRIPMQHVTNQSAIEAHMQNLTDMGDPPTYDPYLLEAARVLNGTNAAIKHIIFVGDGDAIFEGDQGNLAKLLHQITSMGITVSTIASGADLQGQQFLQYIAGMGGGSSFVADRPQDLPNLLLKDAVATTQPPIVIKPTIPRETAADTVLRGIPWKTVPPLLGYNITTPKPTATVDLMDTGGGNNNALYAWQRYGLGRSLAFMSDDQNKWASLWLQWPSYSTFWAQTIRWIMRPNPPQSLHLEVSRRGSLGAIELSAISPAGAYMNNLHIVANVSPPLGAKTFHVTMQQTAPGKYSGEFPIESYGTYMVTAFTSNQRRIPGSVEAGLSIAYPDEYRHFSVRRQLLQQVSSITNGAYNVSPQAVYEDRPSPSHSEQSITSQLLVAVLACFMLDVTMRRISFPARQNRLHGVVGAVPSTTSIPVKSSSESVTAPPAESQPEPAGLSRLRQAKDRARSQFHQAETRPPGDDTTN